MLEIFFHLGQIILVLIFILVVYEEGWHEPRTEKQKELDRLYRKKTSIFGRFF